MGTPEHVQVHVANRTEATAFDQDWFLVEEFRRLKHFAVGREHSGAAQAQFDQLQAHQAIVDTAEGDAGELDHVDFDTRRR